ncbi:uncharacterized protein LOC143293132 [Babylonia areolata]|uniref:uncharacterized protein LOC143293132 n=1 Tax=Babylonia areolata TaxID=304850 RepID=UPI003FD5B535
MHAKSRNSALQGQAVHADKGGMAFTTFLLMLSVWKVGASTEGCPEIVLRSQHYAKVHNSVCYLFVDQEQYWNDARSACWNMGGEMLSIKDESTMQFIRSVLNSRQLRWFREGVWLGARYVRGRWRWTTGVTLDYNNWAPGEPSMFLGIISVEDCALMRREDNWRWHDYICGSMKFHYNYICEFPFNSYGHHEAQSGSQTRDNGNLTILTIILTSGGIVLLILLLVFLVVRRRYNYKKLISQPDVHFSNQSYDVGDHQPAALPPTSRPNPTPLVHLPSSRPSSNVYQDPLEIAAALKPNGSTVGLLKESARPGESETTSLSCSDDDLGACGGATSQQGGVQAAAYVLPSSAGKERNQSPENLRSMSDTLKMRASRSQNDYVHMNGSPLSSAQNGYVVKPVSRMTEEKEKGNGKNGHGGVGGGGCGGQHEAANGKVPTAVSGHYDDTPTLRGSENLYEDFL